MKINYDKKADALYIQLKRGKISKTTKLKNFVLADFDSKGKILGVEIIGASLIFPKNKNSKNNIKIPISISV